MKAYINADNQLFIEISTSDSDNMLNQSIVLDVDEAKDLISYLNELIKQIETENG